MAREIAFVSLLISILFRGTCGALHASEIYFYSEKEFGGWISGYYKMPSPDKVPIAIKFFCSSYLYEKPHTRQILASFFSEVLGRNIPLTKRTYREVTQNGSEETKLFLVHILWLMDSEDARNEPTKSSMCQGEKPGRAAWPSVSAFLRRT